MTPDQTRIYGFHDLIADPKCFEVKRGGVVVELEPKALRVLFHLIENRDRVVSKEELIQTVWAGAFVTDNALTRVIAQIRKQLGDDARSPRCIETVAAMGYRFIAQVRLEPATTPAAPAVSGRSWKRPLAAGAGLFAAAIACGWWLVRPPAARPGQLSGLRQITSSGASDQGPSFSPDGSQIAFSSNRTGHLEIYVRSVAPGGAERQITADGQENIRPAWSPDGQYLAYVASARGGIAVIPVSGGATRYLTNSGTDPDWSPDSRSLVYRSGNPAILQQLGTDTENLYLVNLDGSPPRPLTRSGDPRGGHNSPKWMADGRHVVFTANFPAKSRLWMVDTVTGEHRPIQIDLDSVRSPCFSTDGKFLYFATGNGGIAGTGGGDVAGVWRAKMESPSRAGRPELLMPSAGSILRDFALARGGARIVISQSFQESTLWSVSIDRSGAAIGEPKRLIRDSSLRNMAPEFSADGSKLAYISLRQGDDATIFVANADGSSAAPITPAGQKSQMPMWMGDSQEVGYLAERSGKRELWVSPLQGPPRRWDLKLDWSPFSYLRISREGTRLAAHAGSLAGDLRLIVVDLATGATRNLTPPGRKILFPCWSPDGRWIAAEERVGDNDRLVVIDVASGAIQTLVTGPVRAWPHDWAPDNDRIVFAESRGGVWNIYWVARSKGEIHQLTHFDSGSGFVRAPAWSPRDNQVVFERFDLAANLYVADLR